MGLYLETIRFNLYYQLAYPSEVLAFIVRRLVNLTFLLLFWLAVSKGNSELFGFRQIVAYFLVANAVEDLTFTSSGGWDKDFRRTIKYGLLSNYLIKPVPILRFWYASYVGKRTVETIYGLVSLCAGLVLFPPSDIVAVPLFVLSLVLTAIAGAGLTLLVGIVAFYSPEAGSISNVVDHITHIFSGHLIPLSYFPTTIRTIATFLPFPVLTYFPVSILQQGGLNADTFTKLGLSLFWAATLLFIGNLCWKKAIRNYDGVGI